MPQALPILFVPDKQKTAGNPADLPTAFRTIERWANRIALQTGITQITSVDGSVTITDPTGPTVDLSAPGGGGGLYASLTGPGETTTPGDLTQAGGFTVDTALGHPIQLVTRGGTVNAIHLQTGGGPPAVPVTNTIDLDDQAAPDPFNGGINIGTAKGTITLDGIRTIIYSNRPTSGPYLGQTYPITIRSGGGSNGSGGFVTAPSVPLWTNNGNPNVYSVSTGGGIMPGTTGAFCFDTSNGAIWVYTGSTWRQITV